MNYLIDLPFLFFCSDIFRFSLALFWMLADNNIHSIGSAVINYNPQETGDKRKEKLDELNLTRVFFLLQVTTSPLLCHK